MKKKVRKRRQKNEEDKQEMQTDLSYFDLFQQSTNKSGNC